MGYEQNANGIGEIEGIVLANPGAGNEISLTVPQQETWEFLGLTYDLNTSATVANRVIKVIFVINGVTMRAYSDRQLPENSSEKHDWVQVRASYYITTGNYPAGSHNYLLPFMMLDGNGGGTVRIGTSTNNLQAGDTFTNVQLIIRRWTK